MEIRKRLTVGEYVEQSNVKWSTVVQALADLYSAYNEDNYSDREVDLALQRLMDAYDKWLN